MQQSTRARVMLAATTPAAGGMAGSAGVHAARLFGAGLTAFAVVWLVVTVTMLAVAVMVTLAQWRTAGSRDQRS